MVRVRVTSSRNACMRHLGQKEYIPVNGAWITKQKALLEKHLREQGESGAPLAELRQVLPAESERSIQRLLSEMRDEGKVALHGKRRWARWVFAKAKTRNDK